jgi:hypothetical protein
MAINPNGISVKIFDNKLRQQAVFLIFFKIFNTLALLPVFYENVKYSDDFTMMRIAARDGRSLSIGRTSIPVQAGSIPMHFRQSIHLIRYLSRLFL